jgi:DNA-binding winged helix-turn-helix (wHTH) protein/predicted ATPase
MSIDIQYVFPPFTLDVANQSLLRGGEKVFLRSKSFAVLSYLVEHPHRPITRDELMEEVWPKAKVVEAALRVSIQEIRKALGDDPAKPKFVETLGKNGYRFIAPISLKLGQQSDGKSPLPFVGRAIELEQLRTHLKLANSGQRQVVFVTGEPGIGKTTLVDAFTSGLSINEPIVAARGQCIEQYGAGEAYMPILDALEQLCRTAHDETAIDWLRQLAPSWLINLPMLISHQERESLARQCLGVTPERRLREITAFFEQIAKDRTVVLVLEDLHWLDPSTLALISFLARRREAARLLLIGTYREGDVERFNLPLKNIKTELQLHNHCTHLPLKLLRQTSVSEYLAARLETETVPETLLSTVYRRSEGNPLFMINVTDFLVSREAIVRENNSVKLVGPDERDAVPETLRDLIERQFDALPHEDQELLETASVAGTVFSVFVIARVLGRACDAVENRCRELAECEQFLQYSGPLRTPDGSISARYRFLHSLYQNVTYDRVNDTRRGHLHHSIGEVLERMFQEAREQIAPELALHFERAGDYFRAIQYLLKAGQKAIKQSAYQEAITSVSTGLSLLRSIAESPGKTEQEVNLKLLLGTASASAFGYSTKSAKEAFASARALSQRLGDKPLLFHTLAGLWSFHLIRSDLPSCLELAQQMLRIANRTGNPLWLLMGHMAAGLACFYLGDFVAALHHLNQSSSYDPEKYRPEATAFGWDPAILVTCYRAEALQMLGYADKAEKEADKILPIARELASPIHTAFANGLLAGFYMYRAEPNRALQSGEAAIKVSTEGGFNHWLALGTVIKGWALAKKGQQKGGVTYIQDGIEKWNSIGAAQARPTFQALLGEAYLAAKRLDKALDAIEQGLAMRRKNSESVYAAELHRLKGEVLRRTEKHNRAQDNTAQAEACFRQAIQTARSQKARFLELRATVSICRHWQKLGTQKEAKRKLAKIYGWFTEGFDTPDLKEAKTLLDQLS